MVSCLSSASLSFNGGDHHSSFYGPFAACPLTLGVCSFRRQLANASLDRLPTLPYWGFGIWGFGIEYITFDNWLRIPVIHAFTNNSKSNGWVVVSARVEIAREWYQQNVG
jgi:hypothetical protein